MTTRHAELHAAYLASSAHTSAVTHDHTPDDDPEMLAAWAAEEAAWAALDAEEIRLLTWAEHLQDTHPELKVLWQNRFYRSRTAAILARLEVATQGAASFQRRINR